MNVGKNISYPLRCQGMPKAQVKKKVGEIAEILGITDISEKAGGGCQVAIASVWPWAVRLCVIPRRSLWTNRWARWTRSSASICPKNCAPA